MVDVFERSPRNKTLHVAVGVRAVCIELRRYRLDWNEAPGYGRNHVSQIDFGAVARRNSCCVLERDLGNGGKICCDKDLPKGYGLSFFYGFHRISSPHSARQEPPHGKPPRVAHRIFRKQSRRPQATEGQSRTKPT